MCREQEHLLGDRSSRSSCDLGGANHIDIKWQMRAMLLNSAARKDADLAKIHRVVDFRPGEFFVAIFSLSLAGHLGRSTSTLAVEDFGLLVVVMMHRLNTLQFPVMSSAQSRTQRAGS